MEKTQPCESLMRWLQTFDLEAPHSNVEDVSDGVAMAEALNQIAPEWFSDLWMSKIKPVAGNNWRLKVSNLKKIMESIVDFYQESLNQNLADGNKPDVLRIGEKYDEGELGKLLQLILGCAINCNHKQGYITRIMAMEESVQQVIMQSIQDLENSSHGPGGGASSFGVSLGLEVEDSRLVAQLEAATEARDQMAQRCHELDMQVTLLQEEKASGFVENRRLQERLKEFEHSEDPTSGSGYRQKELRKQLDTLKEEIFKLETSRDDYRSKIETQEKELLELQSKLEDLQKMADQARHLKDEVDILRETADKVGKYEATIASYKKKLDECGDLKRQVKLLEDKSADYMTQTMELEEELKKSGAWKAQLEVYKKQVAELHQRLNDEAKRADKLEFENKKVQEKLNTLQREKERLVVERDTLKETNEELKCSQLQMHDINTVGTPATMLVGVETVSETMIPPEFKEKLVRLQHENKILRLNQRGPDEERLPEVQALLDDANQCMKQLRVENREANGRILELESQVEEFQERDDGGGAGVRQRFSDLQEQLRVVQGEKDRKQTLLEERDVALLESRQKAITLQENLRRKEAELEALNERYQKYIEKAKSVIKSLDPKQNAQDHLAKLRSQLVEKDKLIENMEVEKEETKLMKEREEHMIATAFYTLSLGRQREAVDHRLAALSSGQGQSFLARQRQATNRRNVHNFESR